MYDGAASSERRQLELLLGRLDEIAADLRAGRPTCDRTLTEVADVAERAASGWSELAGDDAATGHCTLGVTAGE